MGMYGDDVEESVRDVIFSPFIKHLKSEHIHLYIENNKQN